MSASFTSVRTGLKYGALHCFLSYFFWYKNAGRSAIPAWTYMDMNMDVDMAMDMRLGTGTGIGMGMGMGV
jgi:hypothetical protein